MPRPLIALFIFRVRMKLSPVRRLRRGLFRIQGLHIGAGTALGSRFAVNWPHQVQIGANCILQNDIAVDFCHGVWIPGPSIFIGDRCFVGRFSELNVRMGVRIGNDCLIASGCKFIDHDHGMDPNEPMRTQDGPEAAIVLEDDVWLGVNVVVLKGVTIGHGAVVAAGAVVTRSIPPMEVWGGVPARRMSARNPLKKGLDVAAR